LPERRDEAGLTEANVVMSRLEKIAAPVAALSAGAGIVLLAVRMYYAISFGEPLQTVTSGAEEESLFSIWKQIQGLPVYADPHRIPFAASYYNWLFFQTYGWITGFVLQALGLGDSWLPTVTRLITFSVCVAGSFLLYRFFLLIAAPRQPYLKVLAPALAIYVFSGPLAGFWTIATNVEFIATVFLILSVFVFARLYDSSPVWAVVWFCVTAYMSWAMKQNYIFSAGAVGLFLLFGKDWRALGVLVVMLPLAWAATIFAGSDEYRNLLFLLDSEKTFRLDQLVRNLANAGAKTLPLSLGLAGAVAAAWRWRGTMQRLWSVPFFPVPAYGLLVSVVFLVPMSSWYGAAENYYFPIVFFASTILIMAVSRLGTSDGAGRLVLSAITIGWLGNLLAILAVLGGFAGVLSTRDWHDKHAATKQCMETLPRPAFIGSPYNLLPWMYPAEHHFILAYNYRQDRAAGRRFERGGIGGLIADGYFAALLLTVPDGEFDGAVLPDGYVLHDQCAGQDVWIRRDVRR